MIKNVLTLLISTVLMLMLLEGGTVVYVMISGTELTAVEDEIQDPTMRRPTIFDPELGWALEPQYKSEEIHINQLGFRSSIGDVRRECAGKRTVMLLGDSMVFGFGEKQEHILTEVLNRMLPTKYCFINTGVVGYSTAQEYLAFRRHIEYLEPELIVLFYTQSNDMWWNSRPGNFNPYYSLRGDELVYHAPSQNMDLPVYKRSFTYRLLDANFLHGRDMTYILQRLDFWMRRDNAYSWRVTRALLHEIGDISGKYGTKVLVIDIPTMNQNRGIETDFTRQKLLRDAARDEGFQYYDLRSYYPADFQKLFLEMDSHWNRRGHLFVAGIIRSEMLGEGK